MAAIASCCCAIYLTIIDVAQSCSSKQQKMNISTWRFGFHNNHRWCCYHHKSDTTTQNETNETINIFSRNNRNNWAIKLHLLSHSLSLSFSLSFSLAQSVRGRRKNMAEMLYLWHLNLYMIGLCEYPPLVLCRECICVFHVELDTINKVTHLCHVKYMHKWHIWMHMHIRTARKWVLPSKQNIQQQQQQTRQTKKKMLSFSYVKCQNGKQRV